MLSLAPHLLLWVLLLLYEAVEFPAPLPTPLVGVSASMTGSISAPGPREILDFWQRAMLRDKVILEPMRICEEEKAFFQMMIKVWF